MTEIFQMIQSSHLVVDSGTGTTAVGLALGTICLGCVLVELYILVVEAYHMLKIFLFLLHVRLPWEITAVMLADAVEGYQQQEKHLISNFKRHFCLNFIENGLNDIDNGIVQWVERRYPRK